MWRRQLFSDSLFMTKAVMNIKIRHTVFTRGVGVRILWQKIIKSEKTRWLKWRENCQKKHSEWLNVIFRLCDKWQQCDNMQYAVARWYATLGSVNTRRMVCFLYTNQLVSKIVLLEAWKHSDHLIYNFCSTGAQGKIIFCFATGKVPSKQLILICCYLYHF